MVLTWRGCQWTWRKTLYASSICSCRSRVSFVERLTRRGPLIRVRLRVKREALMALTNILLFVNPIWRALEIVQVNTSSNSMISLLVKGHSQVFLCCAEIFNGWILQQMRTAQRNEIHNYLKPQRCIIKDIRLQSRTNLVIGCAM